MRAMGVCTNGHILQIHCNYFMGSCTLKVVQVQVGRRQHHYLTWHCLYVDNSCCCESRQAEVTFQLMLQGILTSQMRLMQQHAVDVAGCTCYILHTNMSTSADVRT